MQIEQFHWTPTEGWNPAMPGQSPLRPQLVLLFGERARLQTASLMDPLHTAYPQAYCLGCSTAGEIHGTQVSDGSLVLTAIQFEQTQVVGHHIQLEPGDTGFQAGQALVHRFDAEGLQHLFVLSDGLHVNGSELVRGVMAALPAGVTVTGGLSGDGDRFGTTVVMGADTVQSQMIAAVGLYGDRLHVDFGSLAGWSPFGPLRQVTQSQNNVLYELDGQSALDLYKTYLGEHAERLPASGLLFPLNVWPQPGDEPVVRTLLAVDNVAKSLTFAGDIPAGATVQLMRCSFNHLVDGAAEAAEISVTNIPEGKPELAILISCVGRKLVLKQRVEEEVESIRDVVGDNTVLTGFYSYGEIAASAKGHAPKLHNQTMTITTFAES
ncbi:MAG: FIST C-terminal domain-containing protein [Cyanobacteria bacterium]|nr:FIST C-terminal domain-containing protein [Cyanobacteriota bacterium]MDA0864925.1 FIST C-terminal domain-containing protein [Cyanobacteriota bacterium]